MSTNRGNKQTSFRHGISRAELLKIQKEINDVKKQSANKVHNQRLNKELIEDGTIGELEDFGKKEMPFSRNTEPMFHPDMLDNIGTQKRQVFQSVPTYNPLDKDVKCVSPGPTKKRPYNKKQTLATTEMSKPHVQSVGVVPVRSTQGIGSLNVMMQGVSIGGDELTIDAVKMANENSLEETRPPTTESIVHQPEHTEVPQDMVPTTDLASHHKPAIVGSVGTTMKLTLSERSKPVPVSNIKAVSIQKRKSGDSKKSRRQGTKSKKTIPSSATIEDDFDSEIMYESDDSDFDVSRDGRHQRDMTSSGRKNTAGSRSAVSRGAISVSSHKSVSELLAEAEEIATPDSIPLYKKAQKRAEKEKKSLKHKPVLEEGNAPVERTVDDIIASLKAAREGGKPKKSEVDLKIQEIMKRVMNRSKEILGEESQAPSPDAGEEEQESQDQEEEEAHPADEQTNGLVPEIQVTESMESLVQDSYEQLSVSPPSRAQTATPNIIKETAPVVEEKDDAEKNDEDEKKDKQVVQKLSFVFKEEECQKEEGDEPVNVEQALAILDVTTDVKFEEILNVKGESQSLLERQDISTVSKTDLKPVVHSSSMSFLSAWAPQEAKQPSPNQNISTMESSQPPRQSIHHFCTNLPLLHLPGHLQGISRIYHTPNKYGLTTNMTALSVGTESKYSSRMSMRDDEEREEIEDEPIRKIEREDLREQVMSAAARRILDEAANEQSDTEDSYQTWERRAHDLFDEEELTMEGKKMELLEDASRLYWMPAPPKMDIPSAFIQSTLFPTFHGTANYPESERTTSAGNLTEDAEIEVASAWDEGDSENKMLKERILNRRHGSATDLTEFMCFKKKQAIQDLSKDDSKFQNQDDVLASSSGHSSSSRSNLNYSDYFYNTTKEVKQESNTDVMMYNSNTIRRSNSAPDLTDEMSIAVPTDFETCMKEMEYQKQQIDETKKAGFEHDNISIDDIERESMLDSSRIESVSEDVLQTSIKVSEETPAQQARAAGLKYILYPKRKKAKKIVDPKRLEDIQRFLNQYPTQLHRSESIPMFKFPLEYEFRVPPSVKSQRRNSLPSGLNFDEYMVNNKAGPDVDVREWARDIWNDWFDEVFPPTEVDSDEESTFSSVDTKEPDINKKTSIASGASSYVVDTINPLPDIDAVAIEDLMEEAQRLCEIIDMADNPSPFDLCRRGAIYRKLGDLKLSWQDLNQAIELEPQLMDAYWHRHLLYLLRKKPTKALEDLNIILKMNKDHIGAYKSRAEIFCEMGELTMAIMNFSQTIKLDPDDHEAYYKRAQMYEQRGDMLLALEDYREVSRLMPSKTDAVLKRGEYQFNVNKNWMAAIKDFTDMLAQEPNSALARLYRGRAYAKQGRFSNAVEDLSAAIHLDPQCSAPFFYRGCILRRCLPMKALNDLSVSLLLDDSADNIMAYMHRGILYMELNRCEDAMTDFESVLKLDRNMAAAHVNLGLIYMNKLNNYYKALQKFTNAIKVDPTYVRALVCRAVAYQRIHELKHALLDYTKAIHLRPDQHHYYMYRGEILLEMKNFELASFCVQHAAELSHGLGQSPTQQAAVQSFLHNYNKAIETLSTAARLKPAAPLFILLGKTQMKAKKFSQAVESLEKALELMMCHPQKPWLIDKQVYPPEAAEVYFLIGQCQTEIPNHLKAYEAFNSAIKIDPEYPEAFFQRGLTRTKLKQSKGILDFNRALALNPKLYQAFLSRAAYYGMKGRYSKAIVNCNEALQLQPRSVRAYLYRGALKYYIMAYKLAIKDLSKALEIDNRCSLAYFNRAVCYHTVKDYPKALRDYGIVLLLGDENSLKVLINRGLLYFERKDYQNAKEDFSQAILVEPRNVNIRHTLGLCCHKLNELEEAVLVYTEALQIDPFFLDAYIGRGNALMDFHHEIAMKMSRHDYEQALHLNPLCLPARVNLAYTLQMTGKFQQAWEQFTACLKVNPNYKPALEGRSVICLQMMDTFAALLDLNAALKIAGTAELYTNRGVVHLFMDDRVNAMKDFKAAIKKDPTYSLAYFNSANIFFQNRQFSQALEYYNKTLHYNEKDEAAMLNRAITRVLLRDFRGAVEDFYQAQNLSPYSAHVYFNRGNLYTMLHKYELAEKDYSQALKLQPDDAIVHKRRGDVLGKLGKRDLAIKDYKRAVQIQSKRQIIR
ncbi:uncharacterized protein [Antedon mediterranea]|uniref:uncharacterized protein isoform X2 n=1 Tax=Antedon mediterranea TaxID=105859 RepID=UPI003AF4E0E5